VSGQITQERVSDNLGNIIRTKEFTYDDNGNRLTETIYRTINGTLQPLTTTLEYDSVDRLIKTTDPLNNISQVEYNYFGKESARIDPLLRRTELEYDNLGDLIKTTYPDATFETIQYDPSGNISQTTDRAGRITKFTYDELNRNVSVIYPDNSVSQTVYSPGGRVTADIGTSGNRTDYLYNTSAAGLKLFCLLFLTR
jgi:YD repeat-containing protein